MRYAILTTPRTGGRALCDCLAQTGVAGMVGKDGGIRGNELYIGTGEELQNLDIQQATDDFFAANRTPNGIEGVKINFPYLLTLVKWQGWEPVEAIIRSLDYAVILEREDKVAQAVSLYIAQATGEWSSLQEPTGKTGPDYSYDAIAALIARIKMGHAWIGSMIKTEHLRYSHLTYEYIYDYGDIAIWLAGQFNPVIARKIKPRLQPQRDPRKAEYTLRFKRESKILDQSMV